MGSIRKSRPLVVGASWILCVTSLAILCGPPLVSHFELASRPGVFNDDARCQVFPFYQFAGASQFATDEAAAFMLAVTPAGARALQSAVAGWVDPMVFSTIGAYVLLLVTVAACAAAAWRLGGVAAAWAAAVLLLGSGHALSRMADSLPRGYCFPVLALVMLALVYGRPLAIASLVVAGALVYPASGVVAGLALTIFLLLLPARDRGAAADWSLRRRLGVLAATALLAALAWFPVTLRSRSYGPLVAPSQFSIYPEAGPRGRTHAPDDLPRGRGIGMELRSAIGKSISVAGPPLVPAMHGWVARSGSGRWIALAVLGALGVGGGIVLARRRPEARRAAILIVAALVAYLAAVQVFPYLYFPERYLGYPLPVAMAVLLPAAIRALVEEAARAMGGSWLPSRAHGALGVASVLILTAAIGGRSTGDEGLSVQVNPEAPVYAAIAGLPSDALLAGWPRGVIDNVPYLVRRRVLVNFETHLPHRATYALTMRRRAQAVFAAYFATTSEPLLELRDRHGVTHLLIDVRRLERPPRYFAPFDEYIEQAVAAAKGKELEVLRQAATGAIYRDPRHLLLDLSRLDLSKDLTSRRAPASP